MEHFDELLLLVDREIVGISRAEMANPAHDGADFFFGVLDLRDIAHFDLNLVIRIIPKRGDELADGNDRLIIEAFAIQKAAELVEHSYDLEGAVPDHDFVSEGRFAREKIRGHLRSDDANRPAT